MKSVPGPFPPKDYCCIAYCAVRGTGLEGTLFVSCPCYIFDGVVTLSHAHRFIKLKWEDERARQCGCPPYMKGYSHSTLNTLSLVIYALDENIPE